MQVRDLIIAPQEWPVCAEPALPLAFVDLENWPADWPAGPRPPFPLVGLGSAEHPSSAMLDAVIEAPVSAEGLLRAVGKAPKAAAVAVQLLRSIDGMAIEKALRSESLAYAVLQGSDEHADWLAARVRPESPVAQGSVRVEREGEKLHVTLDRPWACNAIDRRMRDQLFDAFTVAAADKDIEAVTLHGAGDAFCVGGDLDEFGTTRDPAMAHLIRSRTLPALPLCERAGIVHVHVQGACIGAGLEMAAFAGRVTATRSAWFQLPELAMGLIPGAGGCVSVPRRIGRQRAALMILSGRRIGAATALAWGLIDAIEDLSPADEAGPDKIRG
jgi:enoyl-CoA hydratase/carnithine racemase